jgi:hypothetical protein
LIGYILGPVPLLLRVADPVQEKSVTSGGGHGVTFCCCERAAWQLRRENSGVMGGYHGVPKEGDVASPATPWDPRSQSGTRTVVISMSLVNARSFCRTICARGRKIMRRGT